METFSDEAPGGPGLPARWTSTAKTGVGTALSPTSRVWFTLSHGILNEIYYPRLDQICVRDLGLIITDGHDFFSEEKRHATSQVNMLATGVPAFHLVNTCREGRYRLEKEILTDPRRDVLLQQVRFVPLQGSLEDYHLYVLLAPHLGNRGSGNTAWIGDYKGVPMLYAERADTALALACSLPWLGCSVGYVGFSDGWQDLHQHKQMSWHYRRASEGNVALTGEIDLHATAGVFDLALGFGLNAAEAGLRARSSLQDGFELAKTSFVKEWRDWQDSLLPVESSLAEPTLYRTSTAVLRSHDAKRFTGGLIASLSIPWGWARGDDDLGGYHLVWPRDLVEAAGGLLAGGAREESRRVLYYLQATQEADGHWPQNMWMDGTPYWSGIQMDETAFPILLADLARREDALNSDDLSRLWLMVRQAAAFLVCNGPVTPQDRWEEDPGYSPFTLAVEIASLLAAADLAEMNGEPEVAQVFRDTADTWNSSVERWTYVTGTDLAERCGVDGYYVRITPPDEAEASTPAGGYVPIKNRPPDQSRAAADHIVSPDALALVRFGLRAPDDIRILNTIKVVDALLKLDTPAGPAWYRYNGDGYGEHEDGAPFDGSGVGRAWPLLTGERAHYELAAGRPARALELCRTLQGFANPGGLIPEQIWDKADIPDQRLFFGRPTGSAMPLVWAHAEYVKLCRSIADGHVFDMPPQPVQRYQVERRQTPYSIWQFNHKCRTIPAGTTLRIGLAAQALVRWSTDDWGSSQEIETHDTGLGLYLADIPTSQYPPPTALRFTVNWLDRGLSEGNDFLVGIGD